MASDKDEDRARQLEALRRHMVHPDTRWEPPAGLGLSDEQAAMAVAGMQRGRRPPLAWLLVTGLLVAVALVGGVFVGAAAWSDDRPGSANSGAAGTASSRRGAEAPAVTATATLECKTAVDRANAMLASAVKVRGALAEHDRILDDPANRQLSVGQVLQKLAVTRQAGASEAARFDQGLDAYRAVVDRCDLRVP